MALLAAASSRELALQKELDAAKKATAKICELQRENNMLRGIGLGSCTLKELGQCHSAWLSALAAHQTEMQERIKHAS